MTATRTDRGSTDTTTIYSEGGDLVFERTFDAPREQVWNAFMDPERIPRWWGPHGTTTTVAEMDVRPGGKWRYVSSAPDTFGRPTDFFLNGVPCTFIPVANQLEQVIVPAPTAVPVPTPVPAPVPEPTPVPAPTVTPPATDLR